MLESMHLCTQGRRLGFVTLSFMYTHTLPKASIIADGNDDRHLNPVCFKLPSTLVQTFTGYVMECSGKVK